MNFIKPQLKVGQINGCIQDININGIQYFFIREKTDGKFKISLNIREMRRAIEDIQELVHPFFLVIMNGVKDATGKYVFCSIIDGSIIKEYEGNVRLSLKDLQWLFNYVFQYEFETYLRTNGYELYSMP